MSERGRGPGVWAARDANEVPRLGRRQALAVVDQAERRPARGAAAVTGMGVICGLFAICGPGEHAGAGGGSLGHQGDPDMRIEQVQAVVAAGAMMAGGAAVQAQTAVQWRVEDGGNGHWYAAIAEAQPPTTLAGFVSYAESRGAVMASITSQPEEAFVISVLEVAGRSPGYVGLFRGTNVYTWYWIDGSNLAFTDWGGSNCFNGPYPNNPHWSGEFIGEVAYRPECGWKWDDTPASWLTTEGAKIVLEWSADCNNDGMVDYGQILAGQLVDANGNGIPDSCECAAHPELAVCCVGDLYVDQRVDGADLAALLSHWGQAPAGGTPEDLNRDGNVDGNDLGILLAHWGPCGQ